MGVMLGFGGGVIIVVGVGRGDGGGDLEVMMSVGILEIEVDDGGMDVGVLMCGVFGELGSGRFVVWLRISSVVVVVVGVFGWRSFFWWDLGFEGVLLLVGGGGDDVCCCVLVVLINKLISDGCVFNCGCSFSFSFVCI